MPVCPALLGLVLPLQAQGVLPVEDSKDSLILEVSALEGNQAAFLITPRERKGRELFLCSEYVPALEPSLTAWSRGIIYYRS